MNFDTADTLWSASYFAASYGGAPIEVLRQYIEQQRAPEWPGFAGALYIPAFQGEAFRARPNKTKRRIGMYEWTWDLSKLEVMTREEFQRWLSYDTHPGYGLMWSQKIIYGR